MAGTDHTKAPGLLGPDAPVVILVGPQLGENIGACARAMLNFGLTEMRLVAPRDGWPNPAAEAMAAGAAQVLEAATVHDGVEDAVADLAFVLATTARPRGMVKDVYSAAGAAETVLARMQRGERTGLLFGREALGLSNDEIALADAIVTFPVNPAFASLNLAQAVLLQAYELYAQHTAAPARERGGEERPAATREEVFGLFDHLEGELETGGFFYPPEKKPGMVRSIRNLLHRAELSQQDVQTVRGMIKALVRKRPR